MTSFPTYDRGIKQGDGFYVHDSVNICVRRDDVCQINGKDALIVSSSTKVLKYLKEYLLQLEGKGLNWSQLLEKGKIPKTDESIEAIFRQTDILTQEIQQKVAFTQKTYKSLNKMVKNLYQIP